MHHYGHQLSGCLGHNNLERYIHRHFSKLFVVVDEAIVSGDQKDSGNNDERDPGVISPKTPGGGPQVKLRVSRNNDRDNNGMLRLVPLPSHKLISYTRNLDELSIKKLHDLIVVRGGAKDEEKGDKVRLIPWY
jgi:hypothetical protein